VRLDTTLIAAALSAVATIAAAWIAGQPRRHRAPSDERRSEIWLPEPRTPSPPPPGRLQHAARRLGSVARAVDAGLWDRLDRLPPLKRRTRPWLAAALGFFFGGLGVALYLRRSVDVLVGIVLLAPLSLAGSRLDGSQQGADDSLPAWVWIFQALAGLYAFLRSMSSNGRLGADGSHSG